MGNMLALILAMFLLSFSEFYIMSKFLNVKFRFKNICLYISLILMILIGIFNSLYLNAFLRIISSIILLGLCNWLIFRLDIKTLVVSTLFIYFLTTIADIIGASLLMIFFKGDTIFVRNEFFSTFLGNILVLLVFLLVCSISFTNKLYRKVVYLTQQMKIKNFMFICLLLVVSINFLLSFMYYDMKSVYVIIINSLLLLVYSYIIYRSLTEKNASILIKAENQSLMESLHQYEDMVDRQRVDNHENKNQLLIIKNMIKKEDKDVIKYIDTIVKDQMEDDEALYTRVMTIPSGGLQGIIYQKMLVMKDEHIEFSLDVGRGIRDLNLEDLSMDDNYRLCKIVGVFLDNAIEESRKIDDKCIMISLYIDDGNLVIEVSNRFEGNLDIDKLDESGYTTKGDGHGYGLSLVKKILSETDVFENERSIKRNVFKQIIRIKNT